MASLAQYYLNHVRIHGLITDCTGLLLPYMRPPLVMVGSLAHVCILTSGSRQRKVDVVPLVGLARRENVLVLQVTSMRELSVTWKIKREFVLVTVWLHVDGLCSSNREKEVNDMY